MEYSYPGRGRKQIAFFRTKCFHKIWNIVTPEGDGNTDALYGSRSALPIWNIVTPEGDGNYLFAMVGRWTTVLCRVVSTIAEKKCAVMTCLAPAIVIRWVKGTKQIKFDALMSLREIWSEP